MESYLLHWPTDQTWRISAARVEGQGKAVVLEVEPTSDSSARVEMVSILGELDRSAAEIVKEQVEQARSTSPDLSYHILQQSQKEGPHSWLSFSIEGIQEEGGLYSTVGHVVIGEQGTYFLIMRKADAKLSPDTIERWATFFQSGRIVDQSLRKSLAESQLIGGDLPELYAHTEANNSIIGTAKQAHILEQYPYIQAMTHPDHPDDIPVWIYAPAQKPFPLVQIWVKVVGEYESLLQGLVIKASPQMADPSEEELIYVQWSEARQSCYQVIPRDLLELEDWGLSPCQPCGFEGLMLPLNELIQESALKAELQCPFCGGKQELTHKDYVSEPIASPSAAPSQTLRWWQQLWQWFRSD